MNNFSNAISLTISEGIVTKITAGGKTIWNKISALVAPAISLDGDTLTITDESGIATSFDILVDGEVKGTTTTTTFDLSTLELEEGTYSITVIAKADGHTDSEASNTVSYVVVAYVEEANEYGTSVIINSYTEEANELGTTVIL